MTQNARQSKGTWTAVLWFGFFVLLIFRPDLAFRFPLLAGLVIAGCVFWAVQARRTRKRRP